MERTLSRRNILGAASAIAGGSFLPVASAKCAGATDPLVALEAERQRLLREGFRLGDAADEIMHAMPEADRAAFVRVGTLHGGSDGPKPIFEHSEDGIRAHIECHRRARVACWDAERASLVNLAEQEQRLLTEFRAKAERVRAAQEANGYAALDHAWRDLLHRAKEIEDRIMATIANKRSRDARTACDPARVWRRRGRAYG